MISIGDGIPSEYCIWTNAHALARFAALSQEAGLVPIVEPEVLMDGDHTIERSFDATSRTLHAVFTELRDQRVQLEGMLLKPNMVLSGYECADTGQRRGCRGRDAALLRAPRSRRRPRHRLPLGRPVGRGGDRPSKRDERVRPASVGAELLVRPRAAGAGAEGVGRRRWGTSRAAQAAYLHRARMNGLARSGEYSPALETQVAA